MTDEAALIAQLTPSQRVGLTLWGEARGSSYGLRLGIASVIQNRVIAQRPAWGLTAEAVCLAPKQFSCWNSGPDRNHAVLVAAAKALLSGAAGGPLLKECLSIAAEVCAGVLPDTVRGATHYYSPLGMIPKGRVPAWALGLSPVAFVDTTRFYVGVK